MEMLMKKRAMTVLLLCMVNEAVLAAGTVRGMNWWLRIQNYYVRIMIYADVVALPAPT